MRAIRLLLLFLPALACVTASAQSCWVFNNGVSSYQTVTTDGTNIIAEEYVDGSASMTSSPPCPPVPNNATHTAHATATLKSNSGRQITANGSDSVCQNCYMISTATAVLPIGTDTSWTVSGNGPAICSAGGVFYSSLFSFPVYLTHTYGSLVPGTQTPNPPCGCATTWGTYKFKCTNGYVHASCPANGSLTTTWEAPFPNGTWAPQYVESFFLSFRIGSLVAQCVQVGSIGAPAPGVCN